MKRRNRLRDGRPKAFFGAIASLIGAGINAYTSYKQSQAEAEAIRDKLKDITLTVKVKAGENGKIFGGVTSKEISEQLKAQYKLDVDKKKIELKETIKTIGVVSVNIKLFEGVNGNLKVKIEGE